MSTATSAVATTERDIPDTPPFEPDPEIIGNLEGNRRIERHDRDAARKFLEQQRATR